MARDALSDAVRLRDFLERTLREYEDASAAFLANIERQEELGTSPGDELFEEGGRPIHVRRRGTPAMTASTWWVSGDAGISPARDDERTVTLHGLLGLLDDYAEALLAYLRVSPPPPG